MLSINDTVKIHSCIDGNFISVPLFYPICSDHKRPVWNKPF